MAMTKIVSALALLALAAAPAAAEEVTLEWKWKKGDSFRYRMTQDQKQALVGPENQQASQQQVFVWRQDVEEVSPEGVATVLTTYESVKLEMDLGTGKTTYDSTKPEDKEKAAQNPMIKPVAALVGERFTFKIDRAGNVLEVTGIDRIMEKVLAGTTRKSPKGFLSDEAMKTMLEQSFHALPEKPVKPGDRWERSLVQKIPVLGAVQYDTHYALAALESMGGEEAAKIGIEMKIVHKPAEKPDPDNPFSAMFDIKMADGTGRGELSFGREKGRILKQVLETTLEMTIDMKAPPAPAGAEKPAAPPPPPKQLRQRIEQKTTLELLPAEAPK
jgi:hypothetical protein